MSRQLDDLERLNVEKRLSELEAKVAYIAQQTGTNFASYPTRDSCSECGHRMMEHRLDDSVTPPMRPCTVAGCACKDWRS